jgi:hypothetical protein
MQDWLSYRLSDLLLFSPRTYYRMFELYHQAIWPAQLVALVLVAAILVLLRRDGARRDGARRGAAIAALLAACWLWVAVAFQLRRYATINWAARYFAVLFVVQAAVLVWYGPIRRRLTFRRPRPGATWLAPTLFLLAVVLPPLAGRGADRTWAQVELIGLTPDATAVATLGLLLLARPRAPRALVIAPLCWCVIGGATLWALESPEAWVSAGAGIAGLAAMLRKSDEVSIASP